MSKTIHAMARRDVMGMHSIPSVFPNPEVDIVVMLHKMMDLSSQVESLTNRMNSLESSISGELGE